MSAHIDHRARAYASWKRAMSTTGTSKKNSQETATEFREQLTGLSCGKPSMSLPLACTEKASASRVAVSCHYFYLNVQSNYRMARHFVRPFYHKHSVVMPLHTAIDW